MENTILYCNCDDFKNHLGVEGILKGNVEIGEGKFNNAFNFLDDTLASVEYPIDRELTTFTLEMWVYPKKYKNYAKLFNSYGSYCLDFSIHTDGKVIAYTVLETTETVPLNEWSHIVFQKDSNNVCSIYINGVKCSKTAVKSGLNIRTKCFIGGSSTTENFNGLIDDVRISDIVRYSDNFEPPLRPLGATMYPNIINSSELQCTIINDLDIDKLEVYVNDILDGTYNNLKGDTVTLHKYNLDYITTDNNLIKVKSIKDGEEKEVVFDYKYLPKLSSTSTFNTMNLRFKDIIKRRTDVNNNLVLILKEKGVKNDLNDLRLEELVECVRLLPPIEPQNPTITRVYEYWGETYIDIDVKGLINVDTETDLYVDGENIKTGYYRTSGNIQYGINPSTFLNKTIYVDFKNGIKSEDYIVESIS